MTCAIHTGAFMSILFSSGRVLDSVTVLYYHFRLCSVKFISSFIPPAPDGGRAGRPIWGQCVV